jgi:hypothetical protein
MRSMLVVSVWCAVSAMAQGQPSPRFLVKSAAGVELTEAQLAGHPYVLWYEAPTTVQLNDAAKAEFTRVLSELTEGTRPLLVAVGDVSGFNFWPVRGFANQQLQAFSATYKMPIYGDWTGQLREGLRLRKGASNLLFVDAKGEVLYRGTGKIGPADVERVKALIRGER